MSELEVQGLVKRLGTNLVVDQVSFQVKDDEFFVLLGPSGSGKTSILRLICGFEIPDEGRVLLNHQDITRLPPYYRNVAVVFQDYGLFPTMTVYENITYGLQLRGLPRAEINMRAMMAAETLRIKEFLQRSILNLSGGELQRVALARVIVKDAEIYLFDEPLSQLDPRARFQMRQEIAMVHRIKRKPSIYITHDQNEAFAMANRIAVISEGKIQQIGPPEDLMDMPVNLFVARFVGNPPMNLLEGIIHLMETRYRVRSDGVFYTLPTHWTRTLAHLGPQARIVIGIRPTMIVPEWAFNRVANRASLAVFPAQILYIEPGIGEISVKLKIGFSTHLLAVFEDSPDRKLAEGQIIRIGIPIEKTLLFNAQNGLRLNKFLA